MTRIVLALLALTLVACGHAPPPQNKAIRFIQAVTDNGMACTELRTATPDKPDTALCEADMVLFFCLAGTGHRGCEVVHSANPEDKKKPNQGKPDAQPGPAPQPSPAATPSPTTPLPTPPATPPAAASSPAPGETKAPDKPKDAAKKSEAKK